MSGLPEILMREDVSVHNISFREALLNLKSKEVNSENFQYLVDIYHRSKEEEIQYRCLILLYDKRYEPLREFFETIYQRGRRLSLKTQALRGLALFLSEDEITPLVEKFIQQLNKSMLSTPYDYNSLETLKGWNALPYLRWVYGYACFRKFHKAVKKHYRKLPFAFKYLFWIDWHGNMRDYPWSVNNHERIDRFFAKRR